MHMAPALESEIEKKHEISARANEKGCDGVWEYEDLGHQAPTPPVRQAVNDRWDLHAPRIARISNCSLGPTNETSQKRRLSAESAESSRHQLKLDDLRAKISMPIWPSQQDDMANHQSMENDPTGGKTPPWEKESKPSGANVWAVLKVCALDSPIQERKRTAAELRISKG